MHYKTLALKLLDGGGKGGKGGNYRNIAWKLDERGTMGETIVGICLLQGTKAHNSLAVRLMQKFPLLVKDIFVSEDYYGWQYFTSIMHKYKNCINYNFFKKKSYYCKLSYERFSP